MNPSHQEITFGNLHRFYGGNASSYVFRYSFELGYNVTNIIKVQILNGQYVNMSKLAKEILTLMTQYFAVRNCYLEMSKKPWSNHHIYDFLNISFSSVSIYILYSTTLVHVHAHNWHRGMQIIQSGIA